MNLSSYIKIEKWMDKEDQEFRKLASTYLPKVYPNIQGYYATNFISVVAKLKSNNKYYILKTSRRGNDIIAENIFLTAWKRAGVKVPEITALIEPTPEFPYPLLIFEFIDEERTADIQSLSQNELLNIYREFGVNMAKMHTIQGKGFGPVVEEKDNFRGKYDNLGLELESMLEEDHVTEFITPLEKKELVPKALEILESNIANREPSYLHNDICIENSFGRRDVIIFDPNASISHPMVDIGFCIARASKFENVHELTDILLGAYSDIDQAAYIAATFITSLDLFCFRSYRKKLDKDYIRDVERLSTLLDYYRKVLVKL